MKVALLSDIHSNYWALEACYLDAVQQGTEQFIFLGDYVSDLAEPQKTMDLVYELRSKYPTLCLRGNREAYMLDCEAGRSHFAPGSKSGSLLFTYQHLRQQDIAFFQGLPIADSICMGGVELVIAHAVPENDRYYFDTEDGRMDGVFDRMKGRYLLTGHSHKQYICRKDGKTIINPGSVGIPQGGNRWPNYALLEIGEGEVYCDLRQVPYDMRAVIHAQYQNGLVDMGQYWAVGVLYDIITGDEWVLKLLRRVEDMGAPEDENAWHRAALELGMQCTERDIMEMYIRSLSCKDV